MKECKYDNVCKITNGGETYAIDAVMNRTIKKVLF